MCIEREAERRRRDALQRRGLCLCDAEIGRDVLGGTERAGVETRERSEQGEPTEIGAVLAGVQVVVPPQVDLAVRARVGCVRIAGRRAVLYGAQEGRSNGSHTREDWICRGKALVGGAQIRRHRLEREVILWRRRRRRRDGSRRVVRVRDMRARNHVRPRPGLVQVDVGCGIGVRVGRNGTVGRARGRVLRELHRVGVEGLEVRIGCPCRREAVCAGDGEVARRQRCRSRHAEIDGQRCGVRARSGELVDQVAGAILVNGRCGEVERDVRQRGIGEVVVQNGDEDGALRADIVVRRSR